jgi:hypothetical protein
MECQVDDFGELYPVRFTSQSERAEIQSTIAQLMLTSRGSFQKRPTHAKLAKAKRELHIGGLLTLLKKEFEYE